MQNKIYFTFKTKLLEDESSKRTSNRFISFINSLEMLFGHNVIIDGLFIGMKVSRKMNITVFDLLVSCILRDV